MKNLKWPELSLVQRKDNLKRLIEDNLKRIKQINGKDRLTEKTNEK
jgi:hypothetical protein